MIATKNKGKIKEIREILKELPFEIVSMTEAGFNEDIEENGSTFEENALIKAREIMKASGGIVMADDSGLEVDFLNGAPGIFSARFGGEGASDTDRNNKLLGLLENVPFEKRTARFVCAIAVVFQDKEELVLKGTCEGYIAFKPSGSNGFGYDPLFYLPEFDKTMAEISSEDKNGISHRSKALNLVLKNLKQVL
ncbi:MAG: non-canonical purine pyrophosphatase, rdgB/HAM1 family [Clostridiales bacterium]|nr:non-canonical purine pyrophosphatase, rdgB/HAM1 family [Clostridiales bacterium]